MLSRNNPVRKERRTQYARDGNGIGRRLQGTDPVRPKATRSHVHDVLLVLLLLIVVAGGVIIVIVIAIVIALVVFG